MEVDDRRFDPKKMDALLDPARQARWDPPRFLERIAIVPGSSVLDLGSGPGLWTFPLAARVGPNGTVWALDVSQDMLDALARRDPPGQVHLVQSELPAVDLPAASVDLVWAAFVVHEVSPLARLAQELFRVLKPGGRLAVLDWRPDGLGESGPPMHHRVSPHEVIAVLGAAGFRDVQQVWQDGDGYLIEARS